MHIECIIYFVCYKFGVWQLGEFTLKIFWRKIISVIGGHFFTTNS